MENRILKIFLRRISIGKLLSMLIYNSDTSEIAWTEFLRRYSKLILKVCWNFVKDYDKVMQQYLFVCEKLSDDNFKLLKKYNSEFHENSPKFSTWLIVVTRNICIDFYRIQNGRRRYPAAIENLIKDDRKFFELYYWKGLSLGEISETMNLYSNERNETAEEKLERINSLLLRVPERKQKTEIVPFNEQQYVENLEFEYISDFNKMISEWISELPKLEKIVIRLRFWDGLFAREISDILNINPYNKVYSILNKALKFLREKSEKEQAF